MKCSAVERYENLYEHFSGQICARYNFRDNPLLIEDTYSTAQKKVDSPSSLETRYLILDSFKYPISRIESRVLSIELRVEKVKELVA